MGDATITLGLSFDTLQELQQNTSLFKQVWIHFINWCYTNWKGMTFGFLFSALFLSLFQELRYRPGKNRWLNAMLGIFIGAPLGVCANCVTPIAKSTQKAGHPFQTVMSIIFSSPSLNIVALTMSFTLLPPVFAWTKLALVFILLFAVLPLFKEPDSLETTQSHLPEISLNLRNESLLATIGNSLKSLILNLLNILKITLPYMILAGVLGAIIISLVPFQNLSGLTVNILTILLVSIFGSLLPVPMTFDVLMSQMLLQSGFPAPFVMTLLFTMGVFSIYPLLLFLKSYGPKKMLSLAMAIVLLGTAGGFGMQLYENHILKVSAGLSHSMVLASEDIQKIAAKTCGDFFTKGQKNLCIDQALLRSAIESKNITTCSLISDFDQLQNCSSKVQQYTNPVTWVFQCWKKNGKAGGACEKGLLESTFEFKVLVYETRKICEEVEIYKNSTALCDDYFAAYKAVTLNDIQSCSEIKSSFITSQCQNLLTESPKPGCVPGDKTCVDMAKALSLIKQQLLEKNQQIFLSANTLLEMKVTEASITTEDTQNCQLANSVFVTGNGYSIIKRPFLTTTTTKKPATLFTSVEGQDLGIQMPAMESRESIRPFVRGRGIASGDFDRDGWPDLVVATRNGIKVYKNICGTHFNLQPILKDENTEGDVFNVAIVDINNDQWPDIYFSKLGGNNYFLINVQGKLTVGPLKIVPGHGQTVTMAAGFSDLYQTGNLSFLFGNWTGLNSPPVNPTSKNSLFENQKGEFREISLDDNSGETLSVLFSDWNRDGYADAAVGNDYQSPDLFYQGQKAGGLKRLLAKDKVIPSSSFYTMSIDSADINNDLKLDIFEADMTFESTDNVDYCSEILSPKYKLECRAKLATIQISRMKDASLCTPIADKTERTNCLVAVIRDLGLRNPNGQLCQMIPDYFASEKYTCFNSRAKEAKPFFLNPNDIKQNNRNSLLVNQGNNSFKDQAKDMGVVTSYWSWNSKFADLDNDEWQDLLIGNGVYYNNEVHTNVFYHNEMGKKFTRAEDKFGLNNKLHTPAYTIMDYNRDGNLDLFMVNAFAPIRVYQNHGNENHSIVFSIEDTSGGNSQGIGCQLKIYYGTQEEKAQIREIKLSGGHMSYDEPVAHFGLGKWEAVKKLGIKCPTHKEQVINNLFEANAQYIIRL